MLCTFMAAGTTVRALLTPEEYALCKGSLVDIIVLILKTFNKSIWIQ